MATITASHFVSHVHGAATSVDSRSSLAQMSLRNQIVSHNGWRSMSTVDMLQLRTNGKVAKNSRSKVNKINANKLSRTIICGTGMDLIFVSAEVGPWSKTGGLGDVLGGLPPAMAALGHRVMSVSPRYDQYKDAWDTNALVEVEVGGRIETVRFYHCYKRGVDRVFVDHPLFLEKVWGKTGSKIYGPNAGTDYKDNLLRFSLLCQAALMAPRVLNLTTSKYFSGPYGEDVIFIANDWHTALLPCYLKSMYQSRGIYMNAKVAFCIHNIAYQGRFAFSDFSLLGLPDSYKSSFYFTDGYEKPVKGRKINLMKAGILESDRVLTVSPYYAQELVAGVEQGVELDNYIRKATITGITNGMDTQEWNSSTDKYIDIHYDITTVMDAKPLLKEALQAAVGLPVDRNIPVIGFIGRLEEQKGSDILAAAIPKFIGMDVQIIILGTGKKRFEQQIEELEVLYPDKARGVAKFNVPLAHMIIAGADYMLIPSRFEPCGLIQLHAMRYGTIPICASTGGLVDTVKEGFTGFQMGAFNVECATVDPADVLKIVTAVGRALAAYGTLAFNRRPTMHIDNMSVAVLLLFWCSLCCFFAVDAMSISSLVSEERYNSIFLHKDDNACPAKDFYKYESFIKASRCFPQFGNTGSLATRKREIAAFLAQISHETTGGWSTAPDGPFAWGLCFKEEVSPQSDYCDSDNKQWPCYPGKSYKGRGPIQLSWNYNYGLAGKALGFDGLRNPDIVSNNSLIAFKTALWFWMTEQKPKPSCHAVMVGRYVPTKEDLAANRTAGFGLVTNIINGGLECGMPTDARVADRIGFFQRYTNPSFFNVPTGPNLDCQYQKPY